MKKRARSLFLAARPEDDRVRLILRYMRYKGYPIAGRDVQRETEGEVSSLFIARYAARGNGSAIASVGCGLYAPTERARMEALPMSRHVARKLLALSPADVIDDQDDLRLFKLAVILERRGFAAIVKSRTTRGGIRRQTIHLTMNDEGRAMLEAKVRLATDEF